jgi:Domain of unknown function (DUF4390)
VSRPGPLARLAALVMLLSTAARPAAAQEAEDESEIAVRRMAFAERGKHLVVTTAFTEIFDRQAFERISSGFPTTVVVRIYIYRRTRTEAPVSLALIELEVVYDLWDEVYVVRSRGPLGEKQTRTRSRAHAVRILTELDQMPIAPLDRLPIGPHHFVAMVVELNPVSPELLAELRRWLSRPAGETSLDSSSSFFGSFVSVFVNPKLELADRTLRIRSQPFYRAAR